MLPQEFRGGALTVYVTLADQSGGGITYPMYSKAMAAQGTSTDSTTSSLTVQPGENELNYSVQVTYYIR